MIIQDERIIKTKLCDFIHDGAVFEYNGEFWIATQKRREYDRIDGTWTEIEGINLRTGVSEFFGENFMATPVNATLLVKSMDCADRELANKRSIEEVTERLEKDIETYKKAYEYEAKTGGHGSSDSGRYEEAKDILEFIKGEEE